jgi:hypothetical protein
MNRDRSWEKFFKVVDKVTSFHHPELIDNITDPKLKAEFKFWDRRFNKIKKDILNKSKPQPKK